MTPPASTGPLVTRPPDPAAAVRDFCAGVLDVLASGPAGDPVAAAVCGRLAGVLAGAAGVAADLRREVAAADAAVRHLDALAGSPLLDYGPAAAVRTDLAEKSRQVARFAAALDRLADPAARPPVPLPESSRFPAVALAAADETIPPGATRVYDLADLAPARVPAPPGPARTRPADDDPPLNLPDLTVPDPDEVPLNLPLAAAAGESATDGSGVRGLVRRADGHRRTGDTDAAADLYDEAIRRDPTARRAYTGRAQVRLGAGDLAGGIADLTAALRLDPDDAAALALRGDASVAERRFADALADYTRALGLVPDLPRVRLNRAVVLRMTGEAAAALGELNAVLAARPDSVVAHYNRGLLHADLGAEGLASTDFETVLRLNPRHADARRHLAACRDRLKPAGPLSGPGPKPAPKSGTNLPPVVVPKSGTNLPRPAPRSADPDPGATPAAAKATASAPSLATVTDGSHHIDVTCPCCTAPGKVAWERLGNVQSCHQCNAHFAIRPNGVVVELARTADGKWVEVDLRKVATTARRKRRVLAAVVALIVVGPAVTLAVRKVASAQAAPAEPPLPTELRPRVEAFARAWLADDARTVRRLTTPTHDRVVNGWLGRHRPPAAAPPVPGADPAPADIEVTVLPGTDNPAQVRVRFPGSVTPRGKPFPDLTLAWEERGGNWYFIPPAK